jgi:RNA polymerase sigma-70 factor (ECF subfamily)
MISLSDRARYFQDGDYSGNLNPDSQSNLKEPTMVDELISRCQKGDERAFIELFRTYGNMIQKVAFKTTRQQEWQRDIYQDVVGKVLENIGSFRGNCRFTTWLYRITVNCAFTAISREIPYRKMDHVETSDEFPAETTKDAADLFEGRERFERILTIIKEFPRNIRDIFSLYYFGEQGIEEIAKATGKSGGAVKAVLWKGRRAIVKELKKQGVYDFL